MQLNRVPLLINTVYCCHIIFYTLLCTLSNVPQYQLLCKYLFCMVLFLYQIYTCFPSPFARIILLQYPGIQPLAQKRNQKRNLDRCSAFFFIHHTVCNQTTIITTPLLQISIAHLV